MGTAQNSHPRAVHRAFWRQIRLGVVPTNAAAVVGVSQSCAMNWYREAGGMAPLDLSEPSGRYLSLVEREEIAVLHAQKLSSRGIARVLGRSASTVSRELARNSPSGHNSLLYRATQAHRKAETRARRPKPSKLASNQRLREYVQANLASKERWSPEQISYRLLEDYPDDETMRISDEAIYQALYVQGRGGLRRELTACLRTGHNKSAIGTLVERHTRFLFLLHLPTDHSAPTVRDAIAAAIMTLPSHLRRSLTWDQGAELSEYAQLRMATDMAIYFCAPASPWQRGTNENTNGLLRQYFPKSSNLSPHGSQDLADVAAALNGRPRKTLNWKTPAEAMAALLSKAS